jgi:hypothetical protein
MGRLVDKMIDSKIKVHCTDAGKDFDMHVLGYKPKAFLEVAFQTIKMRLAYMERTRAFVGSLGGREFVIREDALPTERKEYHR